MILKGVPSVRNAVPVGRMSINFQRCAGLVEFDSISVPKSGKGSLDVHGVRWGRHLPTIALTCCFN